MKTENKSNLQWFLDACRENTGSHFLDSGSAYGRHHEAPPIPEDIPVAIFESHGDSIWGGTLETAHFLADRFEVDTEVQEAFDTWSSSEEAEGLSWFEAVPVFMGQNCPGYNDPCHEVEEGEDPSSSDWQNPARDNVYNQENDLSQVFVYEVWVDENNFWNQSHVDWIYADSSASLTVFYIHTGCDVRGGYGKPLFCRTQSDYTAPLDLCAEYGIVKARRNGEEISQDSLWELCENWSSGYSSYPFGQLEDDVLRWFTFTMSPDKTSCCALLKSGEVVKIGVSAPYSGQ